MSKPCSKHLKAAVLILKSTPVTDQKRLEKLFMIVMIALVWDYKIGIMWMKT
jgi:hypothetical protein